MNESDLSPKAKKLNECYPVSSLNIKLTYKILRVDGVGESILGV